MRIGMGRPDIDGTAPAIVPGMKIQLDGARGEGGGQILRTALSLAAITGRAFTLTSIRAGRSRPGLLRQHLACVNAAAASCGARVTGAHLGSQTLTFEPGSIRPGSHAFDLGSAGSTMLVAQTLLPPLLLAGGSSEIRLIGGTHNPFAPPAPFIEAAFLPLLRRMGFDLDFSLEKAGFFPAGGGRCRLRIGPSVRPVPLDLMSRPARVPVSVRVCLAGLDRGIAEREIEAVGRVLPLDGGEIVVDPCPGTHGTGNTVHVGLALDGYAEVFTAFGRLGVPAEAVGQEAALAARAFLGGRASVGEHLADQLVLPMALAAGGSFLTGQPSSHLRTQVETLETFVGRCVTIEPEDAQAHRVRVEPVSVGR